MKIILFGSTGMLGRYLYMVLKDDYEIHCISRDKYDIENDSWKKLEDILNKCLHENDVIINCAGIIPQKYKNDNFKSYIRVNTLFPHKLNEISKKNSYKFIHITTDCVFSFCHRFQKHKILSAPVEAKILPSEFTFIFSTRFLCLFNSP